MLKFLNSPNRRLLVADEVGLGKTIEAGHIMLELKARKQLDNVLIICPKSLQEKWKAELIEKFALNFKIYETGKDLIDDLENNRGNVHAIINYEKIRYQKPKEKTAKVDAKKKYTNLVDYLMSNSCRFSLVLCDEAHKMRNRETKTYQGAEIIMGYADSAVFLTATPIMISTENLYNLLHLLDNTRYFNYQIFDNRLQENRPFVEAISKLNTKTPLPTIAKELNEAEIRTSFSNSDDEEIFSNVTTVGDSFANDPVYQYLEELFKKQDSPKIQISMDGKGRCKDNIWIE
ncbi:MAG: SNF2-related protein, partial [Prevotella sp.]